VQQSSPPLQVLPPGEFTGVILEPMSVNAQSFMTTTATVSRDVDNKLRRLRYKQAKYKHRYKHRRRPKTISRNITGCRITSIDNFISEIKCTEVIVFRVTVRVSRSIAVTDLIVTLAVSATAELRVV